MTPKTLHFGAFSPTGGTRRVMRALITGTPREGFAIRDFEFTLPEERRKRRFTEEDAVVLCAPVYYGRIPTPLQTKLPFEGNGARALAVVSYGNRAYEDALREWRDVLERHGFKVVGGAAFIAQHSNIPTLAAGRPDERDRGSAAECMKAFLAKLAADDDTRSARLFCGTHAEKRLLSLQRRVGQCHEDAPLPRRAQDGTPLPPHRLHRAAAKQHDGGHEYERVRPQPHRLLHLVLFDGGERFPRAADEREETRRIRAVLVAVLRALPALFEQLAHGRELIGRDEHPERPQPHRAFDARTKGRAVGDGRQIGDEPMQHERGLRLPLPPQEFAVAHGLPR